VAEFSDYLKGFWLFPDPARDFPVLRSKIPCSFAAQIGGWSRPTRHFRDFLAARVRSPEQISCYFPCYQGICRGEGFESDCPHSQPPVRNLLRGWLRVISPDLSGSCPQTVSVRACVFTHIPPVLGPFPPFLSGPHFGTYATRCSRARHREPKARDQSATVDTTIRGIRRRGAGRPNRPECRASSGRPGSVRWAASRRE
jgi:hypothetical protein